MKPCVLWTGYIDPRGYGRRSVAGRKAVPAHRIAWERANGPIPAGYDVHHVCGVRACVEPTHLALMTHAAHTQLHNAPRTYCKRGHLLTGRNRMRNGTTPAGTVKYRCRICMEAQR